MQNIPCPKCDGSGRIGAFGHIANGVCFMCEGSGLVQVETFRAKISAENVIRAEWVLRSTEANYVGMTYAKLFKVRDFCHGGFGLQEAFPTLLAHWRLVGEPSFQAAQEIRRQALDAHFAQ